MHFYITVIPTSWRLQEHNISVSPPSNLRVGILNGVHFAKDKVTMITTTFLMLTINLLQVYKYETILLSFRIDFFELIMYLFSLFKKPKGCLAKRATFTEILEEQNKNGISNIYLISSKEQLTPHYNKSKLNFQIERNNLGHTLRHFRVLELYILSLK